MPIYEYQCRACDHRLEKLQKISDAPLSDCPACGKPALVKLISAAAFRLRGGGWYETDFKKDGKRNLADDGGGKQESATEAGKSESGKKETGKSESGKSESAKNDSKKKDATAAGSKKSDSGKSKSGSTGAASSAAA